MADESDVMIHAASIFGAHSRRGLVELTVGERKLTITPSKAREIAGFLLEAAGAAEGDEVLMRVLDRAGMSPQRARQVLVAMRQERAILTRHAREEARLAVVEDQEAADLGN